MSLFKVNRGNEANLPSKLTDGWAYFCTDTGSFLIDHHDSTDTLVRSKVNAECADKLRYVKDGETIELTPKDINIALNNKADKTEISDLSDRIDGVENSINTTNETLEGVAQDFESYKTTVSDQFTEVDTTIQESLGKKADMEHAHDDLYYTKNDILNSITVDDIDEICEFKQGTSEDINLISVATEDWVRANYQTKGDYLTSVPDEYATEEFVRNKIAAAQLGGSEVDLSGYAQKSEIPTKVSQLQNDSGYLTKVPDNYAKTEDIPTKPEDIGAQPKGNYLTEVPAGYATEGFVTRKIAEAQLGGEEVDLIGSTDDITPEQVIEAVQEGRDISLSHTDETYGPIIFNSFLYIPALEIVLSSGVFAIYYPAEKTMRFTLYGNASQNNVWGFEYSQIANYEDVADKLDADKLPEAINTALAQAKASGEFDGEDGKSPTITLSDYSFAGETGVDIEVRNVDGTGNIASVRNGKDGTSAFAKVSKTGNVTTITTQDITGTRTVEVLDGEKGDTGRGIMSIQKTAGTGEPGTTDTYTISYSDGTDSTFTVYNGANGDVQALDIVKYGVPVLALTGDVSAMSKDNAVTLSYVYGDRTGNCTLKWQGNSSLAYPKKNYTIKFDQAFEAATGWGAQKKYCLKADFIDFSHTRNIVSAKLWGKIVKNRRGGTIEQIKNLPNGGAVDGFPCVIFINDVFIGVYNFNIPKDGWMFGMGTGQKEAVVCTENYTFDKTVVLDGTDLELEYVTDENDSAWVAESLNRLVTAVRNSDGTDIDTTIAQYLDIDSAIDYFIFTVLNLGNDNVSKNTILATYDGIKWFFSAYDMDGTWGLKWDGKEFYSAAINSCMPAGSLKGFARVHTLMNLLYKHKFDAIRKRYWELRDWIVSYENIEKMFVNYASGIPKALLAEDARIWPTIPSTETNDVSQIINWYQNRCIAMDEDIGVLEEKGRVYTPDIEGFIRGAGTISPSANYRRTDYLPLEGIVEAEYCTYVVFAEDPSNNMATWALFDADKKWIVSSDDVYNKEEYGFPLYGTGNMTQYGLMRKTISITELLEAYPNAKYIVLSTNNTPVFEIGRNTDNVDVGWGSEKQYIALRGDFVDDGPATEGDLTDEVIQEIANKVAQILDSVEKDFRVDLTITGFTRANGGTFSPATSGLRSSYIPMNGVTKIFGNAGFYSSCATIAFYDANKVYLSDISVLGTAFISVSGATYGEGIFELDVTGEEYANAAYFVVSTYRNTTTSYNYIQTFEDDYCKYTKLVDGEVEEKPYYRIGHNTISFFGDNITSGAGDGNYPSLISSITGAVVTNYGQSGATLASGTSTTHHIVDLVSSYTGSDDIICVSGGLNDMKQSVPIGTVTKGYADKLDTTTVVGALESIFQKLLTEHTTAKIYYVITHKAASAEINANSLGLTFTDYHDAIVRVLEKYSIPFYDAFTDSGFITSTYGAWGEAIRNLYTVNADGIHPNEEGYMKYYVYQIISMMEHGYGSGRVSSSDYLSIIANLEKRIEALENK